MDRYDIVKQVGKGAFGKVFLAKPRSPDQVFGRATSRTTVILKEQAVKSDVESYLIGELTVMSSLAHANIVGYYDHFTTIDALGDKTLTIVMEFCNGGDMRQTVKRRAEMSSNGFDEAHICTWLLQILRGLLYCHSQHVIHRDLKQENLLVNDGEMKLADFGFSKRVRGTADFAQTFLGTPLYLPPEVCVRQGYNYRADIWSLGVILFEWMTLQKPFTGTSMTEVIEGILHDDVPSLADLTGDRYSEELRNLCVSMLAKNPTARPTARDLLGLPILQRYAQGTIARQLGDAPSPSAREAAAWARNYPRATVPHSEVMQFRYERRNHYGEKIAFKVNVRKQPSLEAEVLRVLDQGAYVEVIGQKTDPAGVRWLKLVEGFCIRDCPRESSEPQHQRTTKLNMFFPVPEFMVKRPDPEGPTDDQTEPWNRDQEEEQRESNRYQSGEARVAHRLLEQLTQRTFKGPPAEIETLERFIGSALRENVVEFLAKRFKTDASTTDDETWTLMACGLLRATQQVHMVPVLRALFRRKCMLQATTS